MDVDSDKLDSPPEARNALPVLMHRLGTSLAAVYLHDIQTMDDLFLHTLQDVYYAENKIVKSLPDMIDKASDPQLKRGLEMHLGEKAADAKLSSVAETNVNAQAAS